MMNIDFVNVEEVQTRKSLVKQTLSN